VFQPKIPVGKPFSKKGGAVMTRSIIALFVWLALASSQAFADSVRWSTVGDWDVRFDSSIAGCFMMASWTQGEIVRIGLDHNRRNGYLILANSKWRSLTVGNKYELKFQFDAESPWKGPFTATKMGDTTVLRVNFSDGKFLREFGAKQVLIISYESKIVSRLPLTGSLAAMKSVLQCQAKVEEIAAAKDDPFSKRGVAQPPLNPRRPNDEDPFARGGFHSANDRSL
jgi:hypothetical protein